jgi:hypothetical protein
MLRQRCLAISSSLVLATLLSYGCSSSSTTSGADGGGLPDVAMHDVKTPVDAGQDGSPPPDAKDAASDGSQVCVPDQKPDLIPWAPPSPFHQGKCSKLQASEYNADWNEDMTSVFRSNSANAECLSCIETMAGSAAYGPVITPQLQANFGGCAAHFDGNTTSTGCGAHINDYQTCAFLECGMCVDYSMDGPMTKACLTAATSKGGYCEPYLSNTCEDELQPGSVAEDCIDLKDFLYLWCGSAADGGPDGATD